MHAERLAASPPGPSLEVDLRRGVSAAYYALFHHITEAVAEHVLPSGSEEERAAVRRALVHGRVRGACEAISREPEGHASGRKRPRDASLLATAAAEERVLRVAQAFVVLVEQPHAADYDPLSSWSRVDVLNSVALARRAIDHLDAVRGGAPANATFTLLLLRGTAA